MAELRFASYLAPILAPVYEAAAYRIGRNVGLEATFVAEPSSRTYATDDYDVSLICSLPYVLVQRSGGTAGVPVAAPVLVGARYRSRPIYFSDVIVHVGSGIRSFAELRHRRWAFNERESQSGYGVVRDHLIGMDEAAGFFAEVVDTGSHAASMARVLSGAVDGTAIDSHLFAVYCRERPELRRSLRVVESLGPSPIQPVTVPRRLAPQLRDSIGAEFLRLHQDPAMRRLLHDHVIERFVPIGAEDYQPVDRMVETAERRGFVEIGA